MGFLFGGLLGNLFGGILGILTSAVNYLFGITAALPQSKTNG